MHSANKIHCHIATCLETLVAQADAKSYVQKD